MKKPLEVVFAPGCFDGFEGTQEELEELKAAILAKAADGSLLDEAEPVPEEELKQLAPPATRH